MIFINIYCLYFISMFSKNKLWEASQFDPTPEIFRCLRILRLNCFPEILQYLNIIETARSIR